MVRRADNKKGQPWLPSTRPESVTLAPDTGARPSCVTRVPHARLAGNQACASASGAALSFAATLPVARLPNFWRKRSTRPPVSMIFWVPV